MNYDCQNMCTAASLIAAQTATSTVTGTGVDISGYIGKLKVVLNASQATAGTSPTLDVKIQESASLGSGYTDITGATFTQVTGASGAVFESIAVDTRATKKYLRALCTIGGSDTPTFAFAVQFSGYKQTV